MQLLQREAAGAARGCRCQGGTLRRPGAAALRSLSLRALC